MTAIDAAASISELSVSCTYQFGIGVVISVPVFIAPVPCRIVWASFYPWFGSIAANDTNYWTVQLRRIRAATPAIIASKTTQVTGGQAFTYRTEWPFDLTAFNTTNQLLAAGDAVDFGFFPTGAPGYIDSPTLFAIRYEPV